MLQVTWSHPEHCKSPRTVSFSIWGSSAVLIRRRRCRNSTYANWYWQWNVIAMKEVGEYFGCMKQSFRWSYWHMAGPRFQPCCGRGAFPVSNLYRRSGLSRVECSLLLSSSTPSLFHRCSLSFAVVVQFGGLWLDVVPSKLAHTSSRAVLTL